MKHLTLLSLMLLTICVSPSQALDIGERAPGFTLNDLDGKPVSLRNWSGEKAVMLVFWATWCPNCEREIPALKKIAAGFGDKMELLAVNVDVNDSAGKAAAYRKKHALNYTVLYDTGTRVSRMYGVSGTPTVIIVDINGVVRYRDAAAPHEKDLRANMPALTGE